MTTPTKSFSEFENPETPKPLDEGETLTERDKRLPRRGDEARDILRVSVVEFTYYKKDGTRRSATGTLSIDLIPPSQHPNGNGSNDDDILVKYYDLDKEDYRSFKINELYEWIVMEKIYEELINKKAAINEEKTEKESSQ